MDTKAQSRMIKNELHQCLRDARSSLLSKVDGLGEYSLRRPMTPTGTNLLGIIKHLGSEEYGYLGEVFDRPPREPAPGRGGLAHDSVDWDAETRGNPGMWARPNELSDYLLGFYRRACVHGVE